MTAAPTVVDESPTPIEAQDDLPDPYEHRRRQLEESKLLEQRAKAVAVFVKRLKWCCALSMLLAIFLLISSFWYAHAINLITGALGFYGALKVKSEFLFVHLILLCLTAVKSFGLMYLQISDHGTDYEAFLIALLFVDTLIVTPIAFYLSYWLYQTLGTEVTGVRFSDLDMLQGSVDYATSGTGVRGSRLV